jgi:hypothetical protein
VLQRENMKSFDDGSFEHNVRMRLIDFLYGISPFDVIVHHSLSMDKRQTEKEAEKEK